ncbi:hypothetical protein GCM10009721_30370 [Terrabacter tumescens]|uniref:Uncharacterized protein n=1 Tax=Terrabacter tumescens TaxID=60443 RepID=A0ABQ2I7W4_9MICO|nr:hypothetical protein GCM10009721_30370 [Terrabacter tumescens]
MVRRDGCRLGGRVESLGEAAEQERRADVTADAARVAVGRLRVVRRGDALDDALAGHRLLE